jgi:predicted O-methyltransferase YrrM
MLLRKPKAVAPTIKLPLLPALTGHLPDEIALLDAMRAVTASPDYLQLARDLETWPPNSLISTHERAVLHWLVSETRARAILEIGTAFAGTTLLLAASMLQVGRGKLYTIDPYGKERAPGVIAGWPTSLQEIVEFTPKFSSDFFIPSLDIPPLDLVLIDGNHSYPNVMHDVFAAYEALRPGGFAVLDNAEQIDVLDAARDFGRLTRHAELVRVALGEHSPSGGYGFDIDDHLNPVETNSAFVVVRKPKAIHLTRRALAFHLNQFRGTALTEVEAVVVNGTARPIPLTGRINLRSIPYETGNAHAHDLSQRFGATIQPGRHELKFPIAGLHLPEKVNTSRVFVEANLATADEEDDLVLESLKINGFPVMPGRNFMRARR